jgi:signal transduction histidine kinase
LAQKVAFHSERMDISTLPEKNYFEVLRDTYRKKYAGQPMDLIIAVNFRALNFLDRHAEDLWPKIPILFCGVEEGRRKQLNQLRSNITGIFANARFGDMLDTVFKIHPDTQQVMVIVGSSNTDRFIENRVRKSYGKFSDRADFTYLSDYSFDAILSKVTDLPPDSIVMFLTLLEDGEGKTVPENALHLISRASNAPVYGLFDVYVGHGIVGGTVYSVEDRGNRIGLLGVRILAGEKARDIPFETGQKHFNLYDWRQLQRWGIAENDLPPGSIVRYRNLTFYETYKRYIWGGILLVLLEALMIIHLLFNRSRRMRAERKLQKAHYELGDMVTELKAANVGLENEITERKQTEKALKDSEHRLKEAMASRALLQNEVKHLDRVATMGTLTAAIAHEINQPLGAILSNAQAAIRFLNAEQSDIHHVREALDDIVSDDKRAAEVIRRLRNMLKKEDLKRETLELNNDIREIVDLLQSEMIINNASIKMDLDMELPAISGDRIQIQQVILNLLINALEAVKDQPEKNREIRLSTGLELHDRILISVSDSGPGIEAHERESIFEAFYTTKKTGMGMGLPISKSIIEQHDGRIWVSNNPEGGAVFAFSLPLRTQDNSED